MADKKVLFFTAGPTPTSDELTEINKLVGYPGLDLFVRNAAARRGAYDALEPADYALDYNDNSLIPAAYTVELYPRLTKAAPQVTTGILSTQKIITSGVEFLGPDKSGSYVNGWTPTIVAGVATVMLAS